MDFGINGSDCWESDAFQDKFIRDYFGNNSQRGWNGNDTWKKEAEKKKKSLSYQKCSNKDEGKKATKEKIKSLIFEECNDEDKGKTEAKKKIGKSLSFRMFSGKDEGKKEAKKKMKKSLSFQEYSGKDERKEEAKRKRLTPEHSNFCISSLEETVSGKKKKKRKLGKNEEINSNDIKSFEKIEARSVDDSLTSIGKHEITFKKCNIRKGKQCQNAMKEHLRPGDTKDIKSFQKIEARSVDDSLTNIAKHEITFKKCKTRRGKRRHNVMKKHFKPGDKNSSVSKSSGKDNKSLSMKAIINHAESACSEASIKKKFKRLKNKLKPDKKLSVVDEDESDSLDLVNPASGTLERSSLQTSLGSLPKACRSDALKERLQKTLQAAKFRMLNEQLYTGSGKDAMKYFKTDNDAYKEYHRGYELQVSKWPVNPVDLIIKDLYKMPTSDVIADLGCGTAKIASTFPDRTVHSYDLVAANKHVTCCNISKVPLQYGAVDIAVFCLSLMGTNLNEYIREAHRILKKEGILKIAEVESRMEDVENFVKSIETYGFQLINKDISHKMFVLMDFHKIKSKVKKEKLAPIVLSPCLYKKR